MPFEAKFISCLVGVAMALFPYAMVMPSHARAHCDMEDSPSENAPDHQSSTGCHAACLREDKSVGRKGKR